MLSGNRNFEGRIQQEIKANYLASPPLVVAYALAGTMDIDLHSEPLGIGKDGAPVYLSDIWPIAGRTCDAAMRDAVKSEMFREKYRYVFEGEDDWRNLDIPQGERFEWDPQSTYIKRPPYFDGMPVEPPPPADVRGARVLALLGDSVTTDHISPAGSIPKTTPAGKYLMQNEVAPEDFNSYGSRRGNHEVMVRGTFANIRLRNLLAPGTEGGLTKHLPDGEVMSIFDASEKYRDEGVPLIIIAGSRVRHRLIARLGGEGHGAARRARRHREELRAHPPQQPRRHGRAAAAVRAGPGPRDARPHRRSSATTSKASPAASRPASA